MPPWTTFLGWGPGYSKMEEADSLSEEGTSTEEVPHRKQEVRTDLLDL